MKLKNLSLILGLIILATNSPTYADIPASCLTVPPTKDSAETCAEDVLMGFVTSNICSNDSIKSKPTCSIICQNLPGHPTGNQLACCLKEAGSALQGTLHPICDKVFNTTLVSSALCGISSKAKAICGYLCCPLNADDTAGCLGSGGCSAYPIPDTCPPASAIMQGEPL